MTPEQIKQLVRQEIQAAQQQSQYSMTSIPKHWHNNLDAPNVPCSNVTGFQPLPGLGTGVLSLVSTQSVSGPPTNGDVLNPPQIVVFPIPVIYGGGSVTSFPGGDAPSGSMVFFDTGGVTTTALWVKTLNGWYGITPDSTA